MIQRQKPGTFHVLLAGRRRFSGPLSVELKRENPSLEVRSAEITEAWTQVLSTRPHLLLVDIDAGVSIPELDIIRHLLAKSRERMGEEMFIALCLSSSQRLLFAGELLFAEDSLEPSGLIDGIIVSDFPGARFNLSIAQQAADLVENFRAEVIRRTRGDRPLPALGTSHWAPTMADPASRSLWMQWLPKYAAYSKESPLIFGHTGTGKTSLAAALHFLSVRKGEFVTITPRDFSSSELVQAELFGSVEGAYTGAVDRWGLVKSAHGGTLFIDELQSIDRDLQGKLITFIENKTYRRVGSAETTAADVRFLFASNQSLAELITDGTLREDFGYRLERVLLRLLPIRERPLDIPAALAYGLAKVRRQRELPIFVHGFTPQAMRMLLSHPWPGNLRQIENFVAKLCEGAEMQSKSMIDQDTVRTALQMSLLTDMPSPMQLVTLASHDVIQAISETSSLSPAQVCTLFADRLRARGLDIHGGDPQRTAEALGDDPILLQFIEASSQLHDEGSA